MSLPRLGCPRPGWEILLRRDVGRWLARRTPWGALVLCAGRSSRSRMPKGSSCRERSAGGELGRRYGRRRRGVSVFRPAVAGRGGLRSVARPAAQRRCGFFRTRGPRPAEVRGFAQSLAESGGILCPRRSPGSTTGEPSTDPGRIRRRPRCDTWNCRNCPGAEFLSVPAKGGPLNARRGRNAAEDFPSVAERFVPGFRSVGRGAGPV